MPFDGRLAPRALVSIEQVRCIARRPDPVLRNLQITQSYHDLNLAIGQRLGQRDACWSGFAVWASKTAGRFIRGEWLRGEIRRVLARLGPAHLRRLDVIDRRIRGCIAAGNQRVYAEIAPLFVALVRLLHAPNAERPVALACELDRLRPGPVERGGQAALATALRAAVEAASLPPGPDRAQRILLANAAIGAHEQYRLQADVRGAMDAAWEAMPSPRTAWQRELQHRLAAWLRQRLTRWMMQLRLPETSLAVGRDVPALPDGTRFPPELQRVLRPDLAAMLERFARTAEGAEGSAATDWADYDQRMGVIITMFRSRQQSPSLWLAPFEPAQVAAIRDGHVPAGRL
jgi:hypothetical protein